VPGGARAERGVGEPWDDDGAADSCDDGRRVEPCEDRGAGAPSSDSSEDEPPAVGGAPDEPDPVRRGNCSSMVPWDDGATELRAPPLDELRAPPPEVCVDRAPEKRGERIVSEPPPEVCEGGAGLSG
jgi:hypothetical protein